ncbi:MAG: response regulator [Chloroflexota bacterium]|nr:response regulator [Chloroflexota bacterium]
MTTTTHPRPRARRPRDSAPRAPRTTTPCRRILIVDDDQSVRETLRMALEDEGYEVREAEDGAEALAALRRSAQPLLALLDLRLPRLTGDALLRRIAREKRLRARHAFLLVTANHETLSPRNLRLFQRMGVGVIAKPFDLTDLLARVALTAGRLAAG